MRGTEESSAAAGVTLGRRALLRTSVWAVPVIAATAAAPAYAASANAVCGPVLVDFNSFPAGSAVPSGTQYTVGGVTVTLTLSGQTTAAGNSTIVQNTAGQNELRFYDPNASSSSQTIAVAFSQPVTALTVSFVDVDASTNYNDRMIVNAPPATGATLGSNLRGTGTVLDPYRSRNTTPAADGNASANLALTYATVATTGISVTYAQGAGQVTGSPHVGIRTIQFTPTSC